MKTKGVVTAKDKRIGEIIRAKREMAGMAQTELAEYLDITFQQVQKYERGKNRVTASRLYDIAEVLNTPITDFYEQKKTESNTLSKVEGTFIRRMRRAKETPAGSAMVKSMHTMLEPYAAT